MNNFQRVIDEYGVCVECGVSACKHGMPVASTVRKPGPIDVRIEGMIGYLKLKVETRDWHAVADAAMDLRELEVEKRILSV